MTRERQRTGAAGEELAAAALMARGYAILERNCRSRLGELDIVARHNGVTVFVEVRTRRSDRCGTPAESVTLLKQRKIALCATDYLVRHGLADQPARFDIVSILWPPDGDPQVEVLPDAFDCP